MIALEHHIKRGTEIELISADVIAENSGDAALNPTNRFGGKPA
jgi:hypothetical protein